MTTTDYGQKAVWAPKRPRIGLVRVVVSWVLSTVALLVAAWIVPGAHVESWGGAFVAAAVIAILNALLPPVIAALRLPLMLVTGLLLILILDALMLLAADNITDGDLSIDSFWSALGVALVASAVSVVLDVVFGTNDDDAYTLRVIQRIAKRSGERVNTDAPGIIYLEIDGLALPVLQRAMRDGNAPNMARWLVEGGYTLTEWETDLSSQTGASQAGILLGSNEDIPAFRWVEKETATTMACSAPPDCAEIERRHAGHGLLRDGGASRGNLLSGEADHCILTVSRMDEEKKANPGYRAFLANGFNVTRVFVFIFWEVALEISASSRAKRRDVRPRGHRGGYYPLMRGAMCVFVRDLIVYGVLQDMMKGRPAIYATFSSYDEVAHHSGLERSDTLEALRKLDQQFGRIEAARVYAPRPYALVVLSDHGQTQGSTFKQRNGYGLDELVEKRSLSRGSVADMWSTISTSARSAKQSPTRPCLPRDNPPLHTLGGRRRRPERRVRRTAPRLRSRAPTAVRATTGSTRSSSARSRRPSRRRSRRARSDRRRALEPRPPRTSVSSSFRQVSRSRSRTRRGIRSTRHSRTTSCAGARSSTRSSSSRRRRPTRRRSPGLISRGLRWPGP